MKKFAEIDAASDLKMLPFFEANYKKTSLFSDQRHPSSYFFFHVTSHVIENLGLSNDIMVLANNHINRNRYRIVLDEVRRQLNLDYSPDIFNFNKHLITREVFFEFCKYAQIALSPHTHDPEMASASFDEWCVKYNLSAKPIDLVHDGRVQQGRSSIGHDGYGRGVREAENPTAEQSKTHFMWRVDLREFRQISSIVMHSDSFKKDATTELFVMASADDTTWYDVCRDGLGSITSRQDMKFTVEFATEAIFRYIEIMIKTPSIERIARVEVLSNVISHKF